MRYQIVSCATLVACFVGVLGFPRVLRADDLNAPPYADERNATVAFWEEANLGQGDLALDGFFTTDSAWPLSDFDNGGGPGVPTLELQGSPDLLHYIFFQPNFVDPLPLKLMRIQITYSGPAEPLISIKGSDSESDVVTVGPIGGIAPGVQPPLNPLAQFYYYQDFALFPNPDYEYIDIGMPTAGRLHQVVIDTISIPEPSAGILLATGLLALAARPRRRDC